MEYHVQDEASMRQFGEKCGRALHGKGMIELIGDVGAGKTTFVKGLARGLAVDEAIQSPSFTISRVYDARDGLRLVHYDFYRLSEPGVMRMELAESVQDEASVVVVEWADVAQAVLPADRLTIRFSSPTEGTRELVIAASGEVSHAVLEAIK